MSSLLLACVGATLKFTNPAHTGTISLLPVGGGSLGSQAKCQGQQVYKIGRAHV